MAIGHQLATSVNPLDQKELKQEADIAFVGAGPVGLDTARKIKEQNPNMRVVMIERHEKYLREQRLKLTVGLIKNPEIEKQLWKLVETKEAAKIDDKNIDIPIQTLETCLQANARKAGVDIVHKLFLTPQQYAAELKTHHVETRQALEKKIHKPVIVGIDEISAAYPNCKMIIGADGAHSAIREVIAGDDKAPVEKTDLRNMIELKYQVEGEVKKLSTLDYYHAHALLGGILCLEHIKYDEKKKTSEVTLRFLVDEKTFNDEKLKGINAKNLLPLSENNIPESLYDAINAWLNKRGDKNIVVGSATLNKTTLSIYSSKRFYQAINNLILLLVGDAACGFPYMNGLNLGLENASHLADLITRHFTNLVKHDEKATQSFLTEYDNLVRRIFAKGQTRVKIADEKIASNMSMATSFYYASYSINEPIKSIFYDRHPIFESHVMVDRPLVKYVQGKINEHTSDKFKLSNNLLRHLNRTDYDFEFIKALLFLAYKKNRDLEIRKSQTSFFFRLFSSLGSTSEEALEKHSSLDKKEIAEVMAQKPFVIPSELKDAHGKKLSQGLHDIIKNLYARVEEFEKRYTVQRKSLLNIPFLHTKKSENHPTDIIQEYLGSNAKLSI